MSDGPDWHGAIQQVASEGVAKIGIHDPIDTAVLVGVLINVGIEVTRAADAIGAAHDPPQIVSCGACRYFKGLFETPGPGDQKGMMGPCRRRAPGNGGSWPEVTSNIDGCAEGYDGD